MLDLFGTNLYHGNICKKKCACSCESGALWPPPPFRLKPLGFFKYSLDARSPRAAAAWSAAGAPLMLSTRVNVLCQS